MLKGVHLTLLAGPVVPVPVPRLVVDALVSAQATVAAGQRSGFQLAFTLSNRSPLQTVFLVAAAQTPLMRVVLVLTQNGMPHVLMDGVTTRADVTPGAQRGTSTLTLTGEDLSRMMDLQDFGGLPFPAMPPEARVALILAKYAAFGIVPIGIPPLITDVPMPTDRIERQKGTDLSYLKRLADDHGYVFYVEPGPLPGQSLAYWGPDIRIPVPQSALSVNMDAQSNVESLSFSLDGLAKKVVVVTIFDPVKNRVPIVVPIPNINIFKPPLGLRPTPPSKVEFPDYMTKEQVPNVVNRILGILARSSDAISVSGSLDVVRYGGILRNRMKIGRAHV